MANTTLNFKFLDDTRDCTTIAILDASVYNPDISVTCPIIDVIVPNFSTKKSFEFTPSTTLLINTKVLTLSTTIGALSSGIYSFRFSINPNDKVYKTYSYLHICNELTQIAGFLCINPCQENIDKVIGLKKKLEAAKFLVEHCNDTVRGGFLFNDTVSEINRLSNSLNGNCVNCN